ncbi:MAG: ricin-type beta-trefoil lectin domain protein [Acidimicrobiales bacterium]|nr:ricin-type beta-trefoil lectin domain protein [Acidimicrobiales bacterium]
MTSTLRRITALLSVVVLVGALAACDPTDPPPDPVCVPTEAAAAPGTDYTVHTAFGPEGSPALERDTAATTGAVAEVDGDDVEGADLCVTVTVDSATNVPTIDVSTTASAPAAYPVLVEARITVGSTEYVLGYDSSGSTAPATFTASTTGLKTNFTTSAPGANLDVIGKAGINEANASYSPVPATGLIEFGLDGTGISLKQVASAPIAEFHGTFKVAGVFEVDMPATSMPASSRVHIGLNPIDVSIQSSDVIGHVDLGLRLPAGLVGRATQGHVSLDQVPADVQVTIAPDMSGVTFDAHGGTVGAIEAQFSDGSDDALPAGTDGVLFEDLADRYVIFGRITGLSRIDVGLQGTKISADIDITGNQPLTAVIKTQAAADAAVLTTTATFDHLVPDMHLLVDTADGKVQAQYSASAATNSITVDSDAFGAEPLHFSMAPVPRTLSVCFSGTNACVPTLDPGVTSVSMRASEETTLNASIGDVKLENVKVTWLDAGFLIDPAPSGKAYFDTDGLPLSGHITDGANIDIVAPVGFSSRARSIHFWLTYFLFIPIVHMERSGSVVCPSGTSVRVNAMGSMMDATYGIFFGPFRLAGGICDNQTSVDPNLFEQVRNTALDRCMDLDGSDTGNGNEVLSFPCTGNPNQAWMQRPDNTISVLTNPSKCLDGNKNANAGDAVIIWDCHGGANQRWTVEGNQIRNQVNDLCLGVDGDDATPGVQMRLETCDGSGGQQFAMEPRQAGTYRQLYNPAMAQCAALSGGRTGKGTGIVSWGCDGSPGQGWNLDASGNITSNAAMGSCFDAQNGAVGASVILWPCKASTNQRWSLDGTQVRNAVNGLCLEIAGGVTVPGTAFRLATCNGSLAQQFTFETLQAQAFGQVLNPGLNECIGTKGGSTGNGTAAVVFPCNGTANQGWTGTLSGTVNSSANLGKCLDATGGNVGDRVVLWDCHGGANQKWTVSDGMVRNDINDLCVAVPGNSPVPETELKLQSCNGSPEQTFSVEVQQAAESQQIYSGSLDRCVDINNGSTGNGTRAESYPCTGATNQQFQFGPDGQILSALKLTKCLDNTSGTAGSSVLLWDCHGGANQQWTVVGTTLVSSGGLCLDVASPADRPGADLVLASCSGAPTQQWVQQSPRPAERQVIRNVAEHTCLGLAGGSVGDGTRTGSWTCIGQPDAFWHLDPSGQILSIAAPSKCLDVRSNGVAGAVVQIYPCNGSVYQRWSFDDGMLVNAAHGYCLTSMNGTSTMGSAYTVNECTGSAAQVFALDLTATRAPYRVRNATLDRCIQPAGDATANSTAIVSMPCGTGIGQQFDLTADGHLVSGLTPNRCVDSSRSYPEGLALLFDCKGETWQQWDVVEGRIVSRYDGKCLTIREGSLVPGASISAETCDGSDSQAFEIVTA